MIMDGMGITFGWLGAYALAGLLGFLGGRAIDQILAMVLRRRLMRMRPSKKKIVPRNKDKEEQIDLIKNMADKNKFERSHSDLKKELKRQQAANRT